MRTAATSLWEGNDLRGCNMYSYHLHGFGRQRGQICSGGAGADRRRDILAIIGGIGGTAQ